ncbi:uncharacterized protein LOC119350203 [Triticum dicoccoides]|uniref:uncharacterized protein LOC119350203 n=1 Tax=Triticum dicoccoides TaxID=85692 RepID=UPI00188EE2F8|nr:uncharacterized protein LOC119350203 [Triticum dicoccoides]
MAGPAAAADGVPGPASTAILRALISRDHLGRGLDYRFGGPSGPAGQYPDYSDQAPPASLFRAPAPAQHGGPQQTPPLFAKLDFATYEGMEDPLNWLNQCDQFFRGQRTLASDRTWLASYHLRGAAQTWYYALEQDEGGMPPWERFQELCLLRFGPPIRGSRLAALGRLPFTSTVQDYADRFQALACHAPGVSATQRAKLFVGGLPDHIRVDIELRDPPDLQTATEENDSPDPLHPPAAPEDAAADSAATACVVSLHALAGIRGEQTMLLPVTIHGERLVALLDTGSTHNFLPESTMRRLALPTTGGERLRITVANSDRLRCHGLARDVPISIGDEHFSITCAGIDLGCFDFILGVDFLRTLGPILWDFDALMMTFWRQGRRIRWEGIGGAAAAVPHLQLAAASSEAEHPLLDSLLEQHNDLFDAPRGAEG